MVKSCGYSKEIRRPSRAGYAVRGDIITFTMKDGRLNRAGCKTIEVKPDDLILDYERAPWNPIMYDNPQAVPPGIVL